MNPESIFAYTTHHSETIIQWVLLAMMLLVGVLVARHLFGKPDVAGAGSSAASLRDSEGPSLELEAMLNKIMEQTTKLESLNLKGMPAADVAGVDLQVQALKKDLAARESELGALKSAGSSKSSEEAAVLGTRIKELEAKLSEYEILEDDIADLSLFKEENVRLRSELEKVKAGGAAAPVDSNEAIVAEFASAIEAPMESPPAVVGAIPDTGDPMADFETTVNLERKLTGQAPIKASAPAESAPAVSGAAMEADDLFAEFSTGSSDEDPMAAGSLDTDKMMAEMAALVGMEPEHGNSLEESIDIEKMAAEAGRPHKS